MLYLRLTIIFCFSTPLLWGQVSNDSKRLLEQAIRIEQEKIDQYCPDAGKKKWPFKSRKIERDQANLDLLNTLFQSDQERVKQVIDEIKKASRLYRKTAFNQEFSHEKIYLKKTGYVDLEIHIYSLDSLLLEIWVEMSPINVEASYKTCYGDYYASWSFSRYFERNLFSDLDFPIDTFYLSEVFSTEFVFRKKIHENINNLIDPKVYSELAQKIEEPCLSLLTDWRKGIFFRIDNRGEIFPCIQSLVSRKEVSALENLLFCPGIAIRISAFEALRFLVENEGAKLTIPLSEELYFDPQESIFIVSNDVQTLTPIHEVIENKTILNEFVE